MSVKLRKNEIISDPVHEFNFLDWVAVQVNEIKKYSDTIVTLQEGQSAISLARINECLAKYSWFYATQTAFYEVYKDKHRLLKEKASETFDNLYLKTRDMLADPSTSFGARYAKKAATMEEIKKEMKSQPEYAEYRSLKDQVDELELKISAQDRFLHVIDKMDTNLQSLKKVNEKEIKFIYLQ